jgi:hypothetical protein
VDQAYKHIDVERRGEFWCVRLHPGRLNETEVYELGDELVDLVETGGCRKLALVLGPQPPECLYSVFLARLVTLRRKMLEKEGSLKLCALSPDTRGVFEAARLAAYFEFAPDAAAAFPA